MPAACVCCDISEQLAARGHIHPAGPHWTVNARVSMARPALVVQTRLHRESLGMLLADEQAALGAVVRAATEAVCRHGNAERVYVQLYNEGRPGHVHFHIVPRFEGDPPDERGPLLPLTPPPGATLDAAAAALDASRSLAITSRTEPSMLVRGIRRVCQAWNERVSLYQVVRRVGANRRLDPGERYVVAWITLAALLYGLSWAGPSATLLWPTAIVAVYRGIDMGLYEIEILLKVDRSPLRSVPRALILRVLNLGEVLLLSAALAQWLDGPTARALVAAFGTVTLQPDYGGRLAAQLVVIASSCLTTLLLVGGIAMIIGKMGDTYYEE